MCTFRCSASRMPGAWRARGREVIANMRSKLNAVRARTATLPKRKMMFVVGRAPDSLEDTIAVGRASYLNGIIEIAGGANIFKDAVAAYPRIGMEDVLARNPEVIVDMGDMSQTEGVTEAHKRSMVALWNRTPGSRRCASIACSRWPPTSSRCPVHEWWMRRRLSPACSIRRRPVLSFRLEAVGMSYGERAVLSDVERDVREGADVGHRRSERGGEIDAARNHGGTAWGLPRLLFLRGPRSAALAAPGFRAQGWVRSAVFAGWSFRSPPNRW